MQETKAAIEKPSGLFDDDDSDLFNSPSPKPAPSPNATPQESRKVCCEVPGRFQLLIAFLNCLGRLS